jgi:mevalonate pyrophosphate decarboxylase
MSTSNNNTSSISNIAVTTTTLNVTTLTTTTNNTNSTTTTLNATPVTWNEQEIRLLIDQRKHRNTEYHQIIGRSRKSFWDSVARRINRAVGSHFRGKHCRQKFQNLVTAYYVSKK